jgi:hypothetical protein
VFFRAQDRIAHRVEVAAGGGYEPLLESAEGSPEEPWPASPALQQVHFQPTPDGRQAALLVGMAGRSHWSASVEVSGDGAAAVIEVACRAKSRPDWLGSTYRLLAQRTGQASLDQLLPEAEAAAVLVGPLALISKPVIPAAPQQWTLNRELLQLTPPPPSGTWPQTIAWRYVLQERR